MRFSNWNREEAMIAHRVLEAARNWSRFGVAPDAASSAFRLTSPDVQAGGTIGREHVFDSFGCTGQNVSPAFEWTGAPRGARSFALLVHDPDAPTGGAGWWHWLVYDIPATTNHLAKGAGKVGGQALPAGAKHATTDYGSAGYGGPCPPPGDKPHRYVFTVYALGVEKLDVPQGATASLVGFMVNANALAKASITATYGRNA
jgi:Raf kinase inhibitor-like YbhB/YbcL family protein